MRVFVALGAGLSVTGCADRRIEVATHAYKAVGDLEIRADAYRKSDSVARPVAVWIHGGALIMGGRQGVPRRLKSLLVDAGFVLVSIDYRLAPETKLAAIVEDIEDALGWIREQGPSLFGADIRRIAVLGASAGGYLALTAGYRARPRPKALVSFWGYGDLIGPWYTTPSPHERHRRTVRTYAEALGQVSGPAVSNAADRAGDGAVFYQHCRQHGIWPQEVSGWDPLDDAPKFRAYMPVRNVTPDYPPTLLVHGTSDTDVPYEQSALMAEQFRLHGVRHRLMTFEGAEHGLGGWWSENTKAAYAAASEFLQREIGP